MIILSVLICTAVGSSVLSPIKGRRVMVNRRKRDFTRLTTTLIGIVGVIVLAGGLVYGQSFSAAISGVVNTTLNSVSGLINEKQIKDMPLNGRSFNDLLVLNTTVNDNRSNTAAGGPAYSISGKRQETNRWTINGMDYVGTNSQGTANAPNGMSDQLLGVDAVREYNVLGHTYGAEYGKRSGGQVTVVTTSGTNQWHGAVFEYLRNNKLDARNFFSTTEGAPPFKRNQFGGSLGGPIVRDKIFIFGTYEGFRERLNDDTTAILPSAHARLGLMLCYIVPRAACTNVGAFVA